MSFTSGFGCCARAKSSASSTDVAFGMGSSNSAYDCAFLKFDGETGAAWTALQDKTAAALPNRNER